MTSFGSNQWDTALVSRDAELSTKTVDADVVDTWRVLLIRRTDIERRVVLR